MASSNTPFPADDSDTTSGSIDWDALEQLDLSQMIDKLIEEDHLGDQEYVNHCIREYKKFLHMIVLHPDTYFVPPKDIDKVWHRHILDTFKYQEFCYDFCGYFIHHLPDYEQSPSPQNQEGFTKTLKIYQQSFNIGNTDEEKASIAKVWTGNSGFTIGDSVVEGSFGFHKIKDKKPGPHCGGGGGGGGGCGSHSSHSSCSSHHSSCGSTASTFTGTCSGARAANAAAARAAAARAAAARVAFVWVYHGVAYKSRTAYTDAVNQHKAQKKQLKDQKKREKREKKEKKETQESKTPKQNENEKEEIEEKEKI